MKAFFAFAAVLCSFVAYVPYYADIRKGKTRPHAYTWLIWTLTTGTAAAGLWYGNGGYGAIAQTASALATFFFFLLSLRSGTKDITVSDKITLAAALVAIGIWGFLNNPVIAVLMVTAIDAVAYWPTYRKLWAEPQSEPVSGWVLWFLAALFAFLSLREYNVLTASYIGMMVIADAILLALMFWRRRASVGLTLSSRQ